MNFKTIKFYDAAVAEAGGGETEVAEKPSLAGLMATKGVINNTDEMVAKPIEIEKKEVKEEAKEEKKPESAETAAKVEKTEIATPETTEKTEEKKPEVKAETKKDDAPKPNLTLDEVLKNEQPDTILKKLGVSDNVRSLIGELKDVDPKVIGLLNAWKEGKATEYLKELTTDYTKMSSEEVMRHQLREDYPKASEKQLNILYKKEVIDAYNLDSDDTDELEEGQLLLDAKADRYRDKFSEKQKDYLIPKYEAKQPENPDNTQDLEAEKRFENYKATVNNNSATKDIFANKSISVGEGDEKFNFPVSPSDLTDILFDSDKWTATMFDVKDLPDGTKEFVPDVRKQLLIAAFAKDPDNFLTEYAKHFKSLGGKAVTDTIDNAKKPDKSTDAKAEKKPTSAAEAMAKHGVTSSGGRGY